MNVDDNADAEGNYTLLSLLDRTDVIYGAREVQRKSMQPVGRFIRKNATQLPVRKTVLSII